MVASIFCSRLAEIVVTVTPSVTGMDWLRWWYKHADHVVSSSTELAFVIKMSDIRKFTSPSAIHVKNQWKTSNKEKLDVINWPEQSEWIVNICRNVRLTHSCTCAIHDNADRIKESARSELKCLCSKTTTVLLEWIVPKAMDMSLLNFYFIKNKLIYCTEMYEWCIQMHTYCTYSTYILYRSVCPLAV